MIIRRFLTKLSGLVCFVVFASVCFAQTTTTLIGTITSAQGTPVANGQLVFTLENCGGVPTLGLSSYSFTLTSGGAISGTMEPNSLNGCPGTSYFQATALDSTGALIWKRFFIVPPGTWNPGTASSLSSIPGGGGGGGNGSGSGTFVSTSTPVAHQFLTGFNATTGQFSKAPFASTDLSDTAIIPRLNQSLPQSFSGPLVLSADPVSPLYAATKQYVDAAAARWLGGGVMTGSLLLSSDPTQPLQAATKQYVEAYVTSHMSSGGTGGGTPYTSPAVFSLPVVNTTAGSGSFINSAFSDDGQSTYDSEDFLLSGTNYLEPVSTATSGQNFNSNPMSYLMSYWNGSAAVSTDWQAFGFIGSGSNPGTVLSFTAPPDLPKATVLFGQDSGLLATSGLNYNSPTLKLRGAAWSGSASVVDDWGLQEVLGSGANPTSTLTITHTGPGTGAVQMPSTSFTGGIPGINNGGAQWTGGTSLPATCNPGDLYSLTNAASLATTLQRCFPANTWNSLNVGSAGVTTLNSLSGAVTLAAGTNVTLTPSGNTVTISAAGGSGGNTFSSIQFLGATSGTVTVQPQQVAGNPTITWPTVSGQVALTTAEVFTYSATLTFTSGDSMTRVTPLTGNVTSFTLGATASGTPHAICWQQDGTGGHTVTPPANVHGFTAIGTTANKWSCQQFMYDAADSIWLAMGPGQINQ